MLTRAAWAAFVVTLIVYVATMNRTIGFIDRGELAATTYTLGIPHPTGYPTLTVVGWLVSHLVPFRPVLVLNSLAAIFVAGSVAGLVFLFDAVLQRASRNGASAAERPPLALLCALFTAFTIRWWQQANGFEVYSLHLVLLPLVLLSFFRWVDSLSESTEKNAGPLVLFPNAPGAIFAILLGLSFTNHMTTVLLAPGLLFYAWSRVGEIKPLARAVLPLTFPFLLGLSPYGLLPIISARGPRFDWGGTHTLHGFIDHLTAREFRGWISFAPETVGVQTRYLLWCLGNDFVWIGLIPVALGVVFLMKRQRSLAICFGLLFGVSAIFAASYQIRELDPYLVGCVLGLALFSAVGLLAILERFRARAALGIGLTLVVLTGALHLHDCDESGNRLVQDLTTNELLSLPPQSLLFTKQWDYFLAASWYFQDVEHMRPDVVIVSPDLLRSSWYVDELGRRAPDLTALVPKEIAAYRRALRPFEEHRPYDGKAISTAYQSLIDSLVIRAAKVRPVLCTAEVAQVVGNNMIKVPTHLAIALRADTTYVPETPPSYTFWAWPGRMDGFVATTHWIYGSALVQRAEYESAHGRLGLGQEYLSLAARFDPKIQLTDVGPLPLDGNAVVEQTANFFERLDRTPGLAKGGAGTRQ